MEYVSHLMKVGIQSYTAKIKTRQTVARPKKRDKRAKNDAENIFEKAEEQERQSRILYSAQERRPASHPDRLRCMLASPHGQCSTRLTGRRLKENL